jgi:hypothetical protein
VPGDILRPVSGTLEGCKYEQEERPGPNERRIGLHLLL